MATHTAISRASGQILVDQLLTHGADLAFCVPGESYLPVLDALYTVRPDQVRIDAEAITPNATLNSIRNAAETQQSP